MKKWVALLALLTAFPPLSTNMYLPAMPELANQWQEPFWVINLTLVLFFLIFSIFLLVYGPLSDRFGRRAVLQAGISIFILASIMCAFCQNVVSLIIVRMIQAAGAASAAALALAITKDVFEDIQREKVLAYIAMVVAMSPMVGPVIGGWSLTLFSWQAIFIILAIMGLIGLMGVCRMPETLPVDERTARVELFSGYLALLLNKRYIALTSLTTCSTIPLFAFVAASSEIYISEYGLSPKAYGYFFGFNALALMAGSFTCIRIVKKVMSRNILILGFMGIALGGVWLYFGNNEGPWDLALPMSVMSFSLGLSRPPSHNLVLKQVQKGTGAASSMLMFAMMTTGAGGMWFISLGWSEVTNVLGLMGMCFASFGLVSWIMILKFSSRPW
ncbi:multidrug effflux MFS transporter [Desulfonatronovibrio magnus]|uniref:multidrug effflux MFS transporter n=1 Tax=Desulfonatronovibrio magnus TaxID=698827 RepID=UPI0005EB0C83|nr:multidrug effflux MFS transporter [Desulfonatronovibrio magnus]